MPPIAFQGELGAYSEEAARRACGSDTDLLPCPTFADVFEAVVEGRAARAVIPIENTVFGSVAVNYDHLRRHPVRITGELLLPIRHHLLGVPGSTRPDLRTVRSHPQALGQCRTWLRTQVPHATTEPVYDTAGAAQRVAAEGDPSVAAIASKRAAERYALEVLATGMADHNSNATRFLVIVPEDEAPATPPGDGPVKTSIVFALQQNVPGALFKSLAVFALRDLDLHKIESRPLVGEAGRYHFYLDVAGAATDPPLARALTHLSELTTTLQVLGSYREIG